MDKSVNKKRDCLYMIKQLHDSIEKKANSVLKKYDLTMIQLGALVVLGKEGKGECTLKEFEQLVHLAQSTTAGIVKRLEQKGFVACFGDAQDKRIKKVRITSAGLDLLRIAADDVDMTAGRLLDGITREEFRTFLNVINKICENAKIK